MGDIMNNKNNKINDIQVMSNSWMTIPNEVADRVSPMSAMLYAIILGFGANCRATNGWLAQKFNVSTRTITRMFKELEDAGCIKVVIVNNYQRLIYPVYTVPFLLDTSTKIECDDNGGFTKIC